MSNTDLGHAGGPGHKTILEPNNLKFANDMKLTKKEL